MFGDKVFKRKVNELSDMLDESNFAEGNFIQVPGFKISRQRAQTGGKPLTRITWWEAKHLLQEASKRHGKQFYLPTSKEWDTAREYARQTDEQAGKGVSEGMEYAFLSGGTDWTDTLVVFADEQGEVNPGVRRLIPKRLQKPDGVYMVEGAVVVPGRKGWVLKSGEVNDITSQLPPHRAGLIKAYNAELGLPMIIEPWGEVCEDFYHSECIIRRNAEHRPQAFGAVVRGVPFEIDPVRKELETNVISRLELSRYSMHVGQPLERGPYYREVYPRQNPAPHIGFFICTH